MASRNGGKKQASADPKAKDDALALALAEGKTRSEAAKHAGMGERTVYTKLQDPAFRRLIAEHRDRIVSQTVGRLAAAGTKATDKLLKLLSDPSASIQLQAARSLLELSVKLGTYNELAERLAALESRVETSESQNKWG